MLRVQGFYGFIFLKKSLVRIYLDRKRVRGFSWKEDASHVKDGEGGGAFESQSVD